MQLDAVLLARMQFAFTVSFHIVFPAFTIGLASWLAVVEWRWLATGDTAYRRIYQMWVKIFAVCFGMGVVSGIVMAYEFGTNWSMFSDKTGSVIGPMLAYEVLTAFFVEASFLGIMLFGWGRVSKRMHFASTCIVAIGTLVSAFWILATNSWMQTPQGFSIDAQGLLQPTSWTQILFNPSFPYRFMHMVTGAYLTTGFVVGGISAYYLWHNQHQAIARKMLAMAMIMAIFASPLQLLWGDMHGANTLKHQPMKVAAMEGNWHRGSHVPALLFAIPHPQEEKNSFEIKIPNGASLILTHRADGIVPGLTDVPAKDRPPVLWVFYAFRVMVGIGLLMIFTGLCGAILYLRGRLFETRWFQLLCMAMTPAGFIAVLAGWFVTEVGRQPYTVYGVLRTAKSVSPLIAPQVAVTLAAFVVIYTIVFGAGSYYILRLIGKGPSHPDDTFEGYYKASRSAALAGTVAVEGGL